MLLLFILVFWGTVAQVEQGLYAAQERFFNSVFFLVFGFLPFPGGYLVLWVLFLNLVCATWQRFIHYRKPEQWGILTIHFGLLLYFFAAFVTFHGSVESNVHLLEQEGTNLSSSYHEWEIAAWKDNTGMKREVGAYDTTGFKTGTRFTILPWNLTFRVETYYPNATAYRRDAIHRNVSVKNDSGIALLEPKDLIKEREQNIAGGTFTLIASDGKETPVLLYGAESRPTRVTTPEGDYFLMLRHKKYELPLIIKLIDFRAQFHPGTEVAKSYESTVQITTHEAAREVVISMNKPFRYKDYTFYQASYAIDAMGREYSTFAVVKNTGRLLPYIASFVTFAGLAGHFLMAGFRGRRKA